MIDSLERFFLEPHDLPQRSRSLRWLTARRRLIASFVGFGAMSVLFRILLDTTQLSWTQPPHAVAYASVLCAVHLAYLFLVTGILVFRQPVESLSWQKGFICFLLFTSYLLSATGPFVDSYYGSYGPARYTSDYRWLRHLCHQASTVCLAVLYLYWFFRDLYELRRCHYPKQRTRIKGWIVIEVVFAITLIGSLVLDIDLSARNAETWNYFVAHTTMKDVALFVCLAFWLYYQIVRWAKKEEGYQAIYSAYLVHNTTPIWHPPLPTKERDDNCRVFDFGCGDGRRLEEFLKTIYGPSLPRTLVVHAYDKDASWRDRFKGRFRSQCNCEFYDDLKALPVGSKYALVHLSHILYEESAVKPIVAFLQKCDPDTLVVVRGCAPSSLFAITSMAYSQRPFRPAHSHLWYKMQLPKLIRKTPLVRCHGNEESLEPDYRLDQVWDLGTGGVAGVVDLFNHLYGDTVSETAAVYLEELRQFDTKVVLPNNDFLYLFKTVRR